LTSEEGYTPFFMQTFAVAKIDLVGYRLRLSIAILSWINLLYAAGAAGTAFLLLKN